jgi:hypothetical protein
VLDITEGVNSALEGRTRDKDFQFSMGFARKLKKKGWLIGGWPSHGNYNTAKLTPRV